MIKVVSLHMLNSSQKSLVLSISKHRSISLLSIIHVSMSLLGTGQLQGGVGGGGGGATKFKDGGCVCVCVQCF